MEVQITYPSSTAGLPSALPRREIERLAVRVRESLFGNVLRQFELDALARRSEHLVVNGRPLHLAWEFGEDVHDEEGRPVFGVCEHDPGQPGTVMISVNGRHLARAPEVQRSSAVHELAHAIFDMPAVLGSKVRKSYRSDTVPLDEPDRPVPFSWPEWRANTFMGAFLVPEKRLARLLLREAPHLGLPLRWGETDGVPRPRIRVELGDERISILADQLAEDFGVTPTFVAVRLRKCGLVIEEDWPWLSV